MSEIRDMRAITIARFGGLDVLKQDRRQIPEVGEGEVLIRVAYAGVGPWDPAEREGTMAKLSGQQPNFPVTMGGEGSGEIASIGPGVDRFKKGDLVYAAINANPKGGFYSEYVAINADNVSLVPKGLELDQAGAMPIAALTAFQGLTDILHVERGEALMILGASGDLGRSAVQLAKRMGARVLAIASGEDGVALVRKLGADIVVDGKTVDIAAAAKEFALDGLDAVLALAGGPGLEAAIGAVREGGRVAYPDGVTPPTQARSGIDVRNFSVVIDAARIEALNRSIAAAPFTVHIGRAFALEQAADAQKALDEHRVGKLILRMAA